MSKSQRQSLSVDLDQLFPGATVTIGSQSIVIKPLGLEEIANLSKKIKGWSSILAKSGVTVENFNTPENILKLVIMVIENAPDILEEAANLELSDIKKLPIEVLVDIVTKIIEVNLKSKEDMAKNFKSLMKMLFPAEKETPKKEKSPLTKILKK